MSDSRPQSSISAQNTTLPHRVVPTVSFVEYLRELPAGQILERFEQDTQRKRRILSVSALDKIATQFAEQVNLHKAFDALSAQAQQACALSYLFIHDGLDAAEATGADEELLGSFLAYAVRDKDGHLFYRGFAEFEPTLRPRLAAVLSERCRRQHRSKALFNAPCRVLNDTVLTCVLQSQQRLQATKSGALGKAAYGTARALLHYALPVWRRELHHTVNLLVDFARSRELVECGEQGSVVDGEQLGGWLNQGIEPCYREIESYCFSHHPVWHWPLALAAFQAGDDSEPNWFAVEQLGETCRARVETGLRIGSFLGLVAVERSGGELLFSSCGSSDTATSDQMRTEERLTVLPDFSLVVSQDVSPLVLFELSDIGELTDLDQVYRGKVSRDALTGALHRGATEATLVARLERWGAPSNVVATAREWSREFTRVSIPPEQVILVHDQALYELFTSLPQLQALMVPVPEVKAFRILRGCETLVQETLSSMGFDTRAPRLAPPRSAPQQHGGIESSRSHRQERDAPELVSSSGAQTTPSRPPAANGKYGAELKTMTPTEMDHVIDYAIIMEHLIHLSYEGSSSVNSGEYTVRPVSHTRGPEGVVEGEDPRGGTRRRFIQSHITAIGVIEQ